MKIVIKAITIMTLLISMSYILKSDIEITNNSILDIEQYEEYTIPPIVIYNDIDTETSEEVSEESEIEQWWTDEEEEMMCWIIQQEVRGATIKHKRIIANIILNRVKDERFPNTIKEALESKNQFTSINNWYNRIYEPDEDTREAVHDVLR